MCRHLRAQLEGGVERGWEVEAEQAAGAAAAGRSDVRQASPVQPAAEMQAPHMSLGACDQGQGLETLGAQTHVQHLGSPSGPQQLVLLVRMAKGGDGGSNVG